MEMLRWVSGNTYKACSCGYTVLEGVQGSFPHLWKKRSITCKNQSCKWFTRGSSLVEPAVALKNMQKGVEIFFPPRRRRSPVRD